MRQDLSTPVPLLLLSRVLLGVAVLTGLGAMHVLSPATGSSHGSMPMAGMSSPASFMDTTGARAGQVRAEGAAVSAASPVVSAGDVAAVATLTTAGSGAAGGGGSGYGLMGDCVLFTATGIALLGALLAAAAARCLRALPQAPLQRLVDRCAPSRRGPPLLSAWPRTALCVIRV